ncbi:MAG: hypothetical protein DHS20C21_04900 [Gemmatimonadota bacterium]|nr:MAG: hypothetical protein DHS20C21_04900 [Gemmatimonadota bacterium]
MRSRRIVCSLALTSLTVAALGGLPSVAAATDIPALERLATRFQLELEARRPALYYDLKTSSEPAAAALNADPDVELLFIGPRNRPFYAAVHNEDAAATVSTDAVWPGGSGGFALTGSGTGAGRLGVWDGGGVRLSHQEFGGRATQVDSPSGTSSHSTHVAGTMIGSGVVAAAKGMSPDAEISCYDWNSAEAEMATAAAAGMWLSNHSYGFITGWYQSSSGDAYWYGDLSLSTVEDYGFGFYSSLAVDWDEIAHNAPNYLICKSAGNDRNDVHTGTHFHYDGGWVSSNDSHPQDGGTLGYDSISWAGVAKNILTVGAVSDIPSGYSAPGDVVMSSFSGWGPTDDGRIKPDIVANGISLYSTDDDSNSDYTTKSGTSMSSPNATGSANLLVDYYRQSHLNVTPRSATTKAILIQTADEAGADDGPDYAFGWGLMNTLAGAELIQDDASTFGHIREASLSDGATDEYYFTTTSAGPVRFTTVWTDPAGTPTADALDPAALMLVNDLDMRLVNSSTLDEYFPWVLDNANPADAATTGDNFRDNVEQIWVASLPAGNYIVRITHKGSIGGGQDYSLVGSVATSTTPPPTAVASLGGAEELRPSAFPNPFSDQTSISFDLPSGADVTAAVFDVSGRQVRTLANGRFAAGTHEVRWDGRNDSGQTLGSGIYFARLTTDGREVIEKMVLVRSR